MIVGLPEIDFPEVAIPKGFFLNLSFWGVGFIVPQDDIVIISKFKILDPITFFDTDDIINGVTNSILAIPEAVVNFFIDKIDTAIQDYYDNLNI